MAYEPNILYYIADIMNIIKMLSIFYGKIVNILGITGKTQISELLFLITVNRSACI